MNKTHNHFWSASQYYKYGCAGTTSKRHTTEFQPLLYDALKYWTIH